jgi:phosphatidylglycerophosphate synthase
VLKELLSLCVLLWCLLFIDFAGYARVILALISFYFMPTNYVLASSCYVTSALLDAFDGHAARIYDQSNKTNTSKITN